MAFPTINYKYNDIAEAQSLATLVDNKFAVLEKYLKSDAVTCDVEFEKVAPQQRGQIYRVEANLSVDGVLFRAEATEESFEQAIDEVRDELDKGLRRAKKRQVTLRKQGGRMVKAQLIGA